MVKNIQEQMLSCFGKELVEFVRDRTIMQSIKTIKGEMKGRVSLKISKELEQFSLEQKTILENLVINSIDGALNNFLWMIEQSEEFDLVASNDKKTYSLKDTSDGLSVDYWNFVDEFSKFKRLDNEE